MNSKSADLLKSALRRSIPLILVLSILGIAAVNVLKQRAGPRYEATARVLVSGTSLSDILSGTEASFVDPQRTQQTAVALASSSNLYRLVASRDRGLGKASSLQSNTQVGSDPDSNILSFASSDRSAVRARRIVNAVANGYIDFRARITGQTIGRTQRRLQDALARTPTTDPRRVELGRQLRRLSVLEAGNASDASLIEQASSASQTSPAPLKDSLLGLSIGLVIGLMLAALREAIDTTVRSETDVEDALEAPILGSIRTLPRRARIVAVGRHEAAFGDSYGLLAAQLMRDRAPAVRSSLVVAVTSSVAGEGKTTTAANLAIALARRDLNVLLADFDFRKPGLSKLLDVPRGAVGLLEVLEGREPLEDALWSIHHEGRRLTVSQNGDGPEHNGDGPAGGVVRFLPSSGGQTARTITHPARLSSLLAVLRREAEVVVLDTPPALLTVEMAELSRLVDEIIVVVRQGHVSQRSLRALDRQARRWPAHVAGAVLTDAPAGEQQYGGYYR